MIRLKKSFDPKKRAQEVLTELDITYGPVAVDAIAQRKGLTVRFIPLKEELSGFIFKQASAVIVVNSLHPPNRQRFTLGHELGHFELHLTEIGSQVHVDKKFLAFARNANSAMGWDRREIEANQFAAELLVPHRFLIQELRGRLVDVEDEDLVSELARKFGDQIDRKSTRLNSSHRSLSRMPSSA